MSRGRSPQRFLRGKHYAPFKTVKQRVLTFKFDCQPKDEAIYEEMDEEDYEKLTKEDTEWIEDDGSGYLDEEEEEDTTKTKKKGKKAAKKRGALNRPVEKKNTAAPTGQIAQMLRMGPRQTAPTKTTLTRNLKSQRTGTSFRASHTLETQFLLPSLSQRAALMTFWLKSWKLWQLIRSTLIV